MFLLFLPERCVQQEKEGETYDDCVKRSYKECVEEIRKELEEEENAFVYIVAGAVFDYLLVDKTAAAISAAIECIDKEKKEQTK